MAPKLKAPAKGQQSITRFFAGGGGQDTAPQGSSPAAPEAYEAHPPAPKRHKKEGSSSAASGGGSVGSGGGGSSTRVGQQAPPISKSAQKEQLRAFSKLPEDVQRSSQQTASAAVAAAGGALQQRRQQPIEPPLGPGASGQHLKLTPLEQQVVELKRRHPGVLLAVEVGYKFRFFGRDAEVAAQVLGIYAYQDRAFLTAGIPVPRLHVHVRRLVRAGHKVGIVRQVETAAIKKAGDNKAGPFERRLTALYTAATLEAGELGGLEGDDGDEEEEEEADAPPAATRAASGGPSSSSQVAAGARRRTAAAAAVAAQSQLLSSYLVCCVEEPAVGGAGRGSQAVDIGLVAVEPSTGAVLHSQFRDGLMRSELESRVLFAAPAEVLLGEPASGETRRLMSHIGEQLGAAPRLETVAGGKYSQEGSALAAVTAFYRGGGSSEGAASPGAGPSVAQPAPSPAVITAALDGVSALPSLVLRAMAHLLQYLRPFGLAAVLRLGSQFQPWESAQEMRLSANTLRQLEIFGNTSDAGRRGSLFGMLDHTQTAFGRRLLRSWVGKPLRQRSAILARLDAVQELAENGDSHPVLSCLRPTLKKLPDLERAVTRAFHGTIRPADFAAMLQQFSRLHQQLGVAADLLAAAGGPSSAAATGGSSGSGTAAAPPPPPVNLQGVQSELLQQLLRAAADLSVPAAAEQLLGSMDLQAASANDKGNLLRDSESFPEVLRWRGELAAGELAMADQLLDIRRQLQISNLQYLSLQNQGEYLIEVPAELVRRVPKDWEKVSSVKKGVRYHPPAVKAGLQRLELAREHLKAACDAAWQQFLAGFAEHYLPFRASVQALAALDCLCSLATLASSPGYCRPCIVEDSEPPQLHLEAGRHPVVELLLEGSGNPFVPNDTHLQGDGRRCMLITGPNMGGKSCYSRQCALICIMAQVGSFVPAAAARLRALDGVYTRMGASDNLALGRSTFAEELGETSAILAAATPSSLVILDELGRGTSTGDGAAIAEATLQFLVATARPLTLFITHYPDVCYRLQEAMPAAVGCFRMAHALEEGGQQQQQQQQEHQEEPDQLQQRQQAALGRVVFLFKLTEGVAPASFGIHVARMAQLPESVLHRAAAVAARVQEAAERRRQQRPQDGQAGVTAAAPSAAGLAGAAEDGDDEGLINLAQQCQQFLRHGLVAGLAEADAEAGRRLRQAARQLLSA